MTHRRPHSPNRIFTVRVATWMQVYDTVNDRELFEEVRDDLRDGMLIMRGIEELGFVVDHDAPAFALYARIDGTTRQAGTISALTLERLMVELLAVMIDALRSN